MYRILIVEDDEVIFEELKKLFIKNGYGVVDGREDRFTKEAFDLAVLDVGLPAKSGYEICRRIKETQKCPVIFLTAMDKPEHELTGFAVGGDDYIKKPFVPAVLLARVARLLKTAGQGTLTRGGLTLDTARLEARHGDKKAPLSKTEFAILKILTESGAAITKKEIIERLWDNESYVDENSLYVSMNRLRERLKEIGLCDMIVTVRGVGYRLEY